MPSHAIACSLLLLGILAAQNAGILAAQNAV